LEELQAGSSGYGAVGLALGVGATLGALLSGRLRRPRVATVVVLAGIGAVVQIAAAGSPTLVVRLVLALGMSLVESVAATASSTLLLTRPPEAVRGRVRASGRRHPRPRDRWPAARDASAGPACGGCLVPAAVTCTGVLVGPLAPPTG
jgi:MFS family permease